MSDNDDYEIVALEASLFRRNKQTGKVVEGLIHTLPDDIEAKIDKQLKLGRPSIRTPLPPKPEDTEPGKGWA